MEFISNFNRVEFSRDPITEEHRRDSHFWKDSQESTELFGRTEVNPHLNFHKKIRKDIP
jgi:hypothetical protein